MKRIAIALVALMSTAALADEWKPAASKYRCHEAALKALESEPVGTRLPPGKDYKTIDLGGNNGNRLCEHEAWFTLHRKSPDGSKDVTPVKVFLHGADGTGPKAAQQAGVLRAIAEEFKVIDAKAYEVSLKAKAIYDALEALGMIKGVAAKEYAIYEWKAKVPGVTFETVPEVGFAAPAPKAAAAAPDAAKPGDKPKEPTPAEKTALKQDLEKKKKALAELIMFVEEASPERDGVPKRSIDSDGPAVEAYNNALIDMAKNVAPVKDVPTAEAAVRVLADLAPMSFAAAAADSKNSPGWTAETPDRVDPDPSPKSFLTNRDQRLRNQIFTHYSLISTLIARLKENVAKAGGSREILAAYEKAIAAAGGPAAAPGADEKAVGSVEQQIKKATLEKYGLDQLFDNTGKPKGDAKPTAEQTAAYNAINAGFINKDKKFEFTPPNKKVAVVVPISDIADKPGEADVKATSEKVADALIEGNETLAKALAAKAAIAGEGAGPGGPGAPVDPANPAGGPAGPGGLPAAVANYTGPGAAGLKSGCATGKNLAEYKKDLANKRIAEAGKRSKERNAAAETYTKEYEAAEKAYEAKVGKPGPFDDPAEWAKRADVVAAGEAKKAAQDAAGKKYDKFLAEKKTEEGQKAEMAERAKAEDAEAKKKLSGQIAARVELFRSGGEAAKGKKKEAVKSWIAQPDQAVRYVRPDSWQDAVKKKPALIQEFFDSRFPKDQSGPYWQNVASCMRVDFDSPGQIEECVGKQFGDFLKDKAAKIKSQAGAGAPARDPKAAAAAELKRLQEAARAREQKK